MEHEGPTPSFPNYFLLPKTNFGAKLGEKKSPGPLSSLSPSAEGVFSHFPQPIPSPAEPKPLFGSVALILQHPWSGSKAKFYVL